MVYSNNFTTSSFFAFHPVETQEKYTTSLVNYRLRHFKDLRLYQIEKMNKEWKLIAIGRDAYNDLFNLRIIIQIFIYNIVWNINSWCSVFVFHLIHILLNMFIW